MFMYVVFGHETLCNIPAFFYPTTILLVDDDPGFLDKISSELKKHYKTVTFTDSNQAVKFLTQQTGGPFFRGRTLSERLDKSILEFRREVYNKERFKDVLISVIDFDMPDKSGFDVMRHVGLSDDAQGHPHSYILLTAKRYTDFDKESSHDEVRKNFISKHDPKYLEYLLESINKHETMMFQIAGHEASNSLVHDSHAKTSFLNDGNFLPIFNAYLKEHDICEGYLFDKQGSFMLLDKQANISWLFVRNEKGMENSITMAKQHNAPKAVLEALESKKFILSLYEKEDFASKGQIDWDKYLLKASVLKDENKQLKVFDHCPSDYYYAFTSDFMEHGIDGSKILSYADFLKGK